MAIIEQQEQRIYFSTELLSWYRLQKRDLPWRLNRDPYRVWVSEIMLQQTRVDTVIPYYKAFMEQFPTVRALAEAPEEEVLKRWEGLGYYSRARNLQAGAKMVMELYDGVIPDDHNAVSGLKGVGPYTSGAVMSIAFNRPYPAVDGNVMRVLSRYFCLEDDIAKPSTRVKIEKLAVTLIPGDAAGDFNQALMELGALICTPKSPGCLTCPVMELCEGRLAGKETMLPIKTKAKAPRNEYRAVTIVEDKGRVLVRRRPDTGLLAQMWELPHVLLPASSEAMFAAAAIKEQPDMAEALIRDTQASAALFIHPTEWLLDTEHIFSHIIWRMRVFRAELGSVGLETSTPSAGSAMAAAESKTSYVTTDVQDEFKGPDGLVYRWITKRDMEVLPFPNVFLRILNQHWQ
ncbi:A/G-specific adenine glycosylase [Paenibacillus sp. strain BS8-2]